MSVVSSTPNVVFETMNVEDARRELDLEARRSLGISGEEFVAQLRAGKLDRSVSPTVADLEDIAELAYVQ